MKAFSAVMGALHFGLVGFAPCLQAAETPWVDRQLLESIDAAKEPIFSKELQALISSLPSVEEIMGKDDVDIAKEAHAAKERVSALLQAGQARGEGAGGELSSATGIILMLSKSDDAPKVKGALSCICLDKRTGLFLTALHPFQGADRSERAIIVGPDGSVSGVARTLLRKTEMDAVVITTRLPFPGEVQGVGKPPTIGQPLWVCGSCPGAVFYQLAASTARAGIPNWSVFGRSKTKWFDVDRGFPNGLSGGAVFAAGGNLVGVVARNIALSSHGPGGAALQLGRAVEAYPLLEEMR